MSLEAYEPTRKVRGETYRLRPDQLVMALAPGRARKQRAPILSRNRMTEHKPPKFSGVRERLLLDERIWIDAPPERLRDVARELWASEADVVQVTPVYVPASRPEEGSAATPDPRVFAILPTRPGDERLRAEIEALGLEIDDAWSAAVAPYLRARLRGGDPDDGFDVERALKRLRGVRGVEINWIKLDPFAQPPSPPPAAPRRWSLTDVGVDRVRRDGGGSNKVVVAVIDTGFDVGHPLLRGVFTPPRTRRNFITDPPNDDVTASPDDDVDQDPGWHGTAVAGLIGARGGPGSAVSGVASGVRILPIRATVGDSAQVEEAVVWATEQRADVVNLSFTCVPTITLEVALTNLAGPGGAVVCAASGNGGPDETDGVGYPAQHDLVIAVGACDETGERKEDDPDGERWFSRGGTELDVVAPGIRVATIDYGARRGFNPGTRPAPPGQRRRRRSVTFYGETYRGDAGGDADGNFLYAFTGTSAAAAIVSGIAALVLSRDPSLSNGEVRTRLEESCARVGDYEYEKTWRPYLWCPEMGYGRVDAAKAVPPAP